MASSHSDVAVKATITKLLSVSAVTTFFGRRIAPPGMVDKQMPYITVLEAGNKPRHGLGHNQPSSHDQRVTVWAHGRTYAEALDGKAIVEAALEGATVAVTGWGTPRFEGIGIPVRDYEESDIRFYVGGAKYRLVLAGQTVS